MVPNVGSLRLVTFGLLASLAVALQPGGSHGSIRPQNRRVNAFQCPSEGFHADPADCRTFYRCVSWTPDSLARTLPSNFASFRFTCSEGTIFDPDLETCNYPRDTSRRECGGRGVKAFGDEQLPFNYPSDGNHGNGATYHEHSGNEAYQRIEHPSRFPLRSGAEHPTHRGADDGGSQQRQSENQLSSEPQSSGAFSEGCSGEGFFPVDGDCTRFVRCTNDGMGGYEKFIFKCADGTVWDQKNTICNFPSLVPECGGNPTEEHGGEVGLNLENQQGGIAPGGGTTQGGVNYPGEEGWAGYPGHDNSGGSDPQWGDNEDGNPLDQPDPTPQGGEHGNYPPPENMGGGNYPADNYPPQGTTGYSEQTGQGGGPAAGSGAWTTGYPQQGNQGGYPHPSQSQGMEQNGYTEGNPDQVSTNGQYQGNQGTYPEEGYQGGGSADRTTEAPDEGGQGSNENQIPNGDSSECQGDGYFGITGDCIKFYRCVDNGKGQYFRFDFECGKGTVWDQESSTCNYPWAVNRDDVDCSNFTEGTDSGTDTSETSCTQNSSTTTDQTQTPNPTDPSHSSETTATPHQTETTSSQQTTGEAQTQTQTTSNQEGTTGTASGSVPTTTEPQETSSQQQTDGGSTTQQGTTLSPDDQSSVPPGSRPCQPESNTGVECTTAGFYPYPGNCRKFYRCVDWDGDKGERFSVYYFECSEGTIWDPALETCNSEESVYPPRNCDGQDSGSKQSTTTEGSTTSGETVSTVGQTSTSTAPEGSSTETIPSSTATEQASTTVGPGESTDPGTSTTEEQTSTTEGPDAATTEEQSTTTDAPGASTGETTLSSSPTEGETSTTDGPEGSTAQTTDSDTSETGEASTESTTQGSEEQTGGSDSSACPTLSEDQMIFVCPTGFRRHPKDCNLFYQCTISRDGDVNIMTLSCKNETIYDEGKIQCLPPDETAQCQGKLRYRTRHYRRIEPEEPSSVPVPTSTSLCPSDGYFPYDGDCRRFFKCEKDSRGRTQGYLVQCPEKFYFSVESGRCERSSILNSCSQFLPYVDLEWVASKIPVEYEGFGVR